MMPLLFSTPPDKLLFELVSLALIHCNYLSVALDNLNPRNRHPPEYRTKPTGPNTLIDLLSFCAAPCIYLQPKRPERYYDVQVMKVISVGTIKVVEVPKMPDIDASSNNDNNSNKSAMILLVQREYASSNKRE